MASVSDIAIPAAIDRPLPSLRSNFSWTLTGNLVYAVCQWGMLSVLAKLGSAALVGQFALGLAIAAPVFMFTNLQLRGVQATDAHSEYEFADYFTLRCLATVVGLSAVAAIAALTRYDRTTVIVVLLIAGSKAVESLSDVTSGLLQKYERLDQVAIGLMLRGPASIVAFGIAFWRFHSLVAAVTALLITWSVVVASYDFARARRVLRSGEPWLRLNSHQLGKLATLSLPLGLVMTLISLNVNLPRYVLEHAHGAAELGIFASLAYMVTAVNFLVNALGQSATARLARMFSAGRLRPFRVLLAKCAGFGAAILAAGIPLASAVGRPLIAALYRPEYGEHLAVFVLMVATAGVNAVASFLGYGMTAARCFKPQVPILASVATTTFVLAWWLVPRYGLRGAAGALLVSAVLQVAGSTIALRAALRRAARA